MGKSLLFHTVDATETEHLFPTSVENWAEKLQSFHSMTWIIECTLLSVRTKLL